MNISIFKSLYKTDDVPFELDVLKVLDRIKTGASKEKILKIRTMPESEEKKQLKNSLISILFNGTFSTRNDNALMVFAFLILTNTNPKKRNTKNVND